MLSEIAAYIAGVPEVTDYQVYSGTAAPISFNGLVRQYYLREGANLGDIQVNLVDAHHRDRKSHEIALSVREPVQAIARQYGGNAKIVEVPPARRCCRRWWLRYGLDYEGRLRWRRICAIHSPPRRDIVDIDDSAEFPSEKAVVVVDRAKAAASVPQSAVADALGIALGHRGHVFLHASNNKYAVRIRPRYSEQDRAG